MGSVELTVFDNGELAFRAGDNKAHYSRSTGNQLIRCARMNSWERFTALWQKKTEPTLWQAFDNKLSSLDIPLKWKIKEAFARLETTDSDPISTNEPEITEQLTF